MDEDPFSIFLLVANFITVNIIFSSLEIFFILIFLILLFVLSTVIVGSENMHFLSKDSLIEDFENDKENLKSNYKFQKSNRILLTDIAATVFFRISIVFIVFHVLFISSLKFNFKLLFVVIVISIFILISVLINKMYFSCRSKRSFLLSKSIFFIRKLFYPLGFLFSMLSYFVNNKIKRLKFNDSIEEISNVLSINKDKVKDDEKRMLRSILEFGNTDVKEVMKSRLDVIAIDKNTSFTDVLKLIIKSGFSRIPVYDENFDNITGVLYIKDLIPFLNEDDKFNWVKLCREVYYVPETKMINDLLKEFQIKKNHIAIVVDEYGGTSGIVTLEDVLEEIVGEINDEFDKEDNIYSKLDANNYIFEGKISLLDFLKIVKGRHDTFDNVKGDSDSLAGLILEVEGRILSIGEECEIPPYKMFVESSDNRRIKRIKVQINED